MKQYPREQSIKGETKSCKRVYLKCTPSMARAVEAARLRHVPPLSKAEWVRQAVRAKLEAEGVHSDEQVVLAPPPVIQPRRPWKGPEPSPSWSQGPAPEPAAEKAKERWGFAF